MTDKDFYSTILGICLLWHVTNVALSVEDATVIVKLDYGASQAEGLFVCPTCGQSASVYDRRESHTWRYSVYKFCLGNLDMQPHKSS